MQEPDQSVIDYVKGHKNAVLATLRASGPPQLSLVTYLVHGNEFHITVRGASLKAKFLRKRPDCSLAIVDGSHQVILTGTTRLIDDLDEVVDLAGAILKHAGVVHQDEAETREWAIREERVVIVFTPTSYYPLTMPTW